MDNANAPLLWLAIALLSILLGIAGLALHKIRRIHLATYQLLTDGAIARREAEALFSQIQSLLALEKTLALPLPLPSMRGWAGSPDFLLRVTEEILKRGARTVVECSSGVSTVVCARSLQINGSGHVYSLEHDPEYAAKTRALLVRHGLTDWATVLDAPLVSEGSATPWYSLAALPTDMPPIDMLVVDGPPQAIGPLARYPALPRLEAKMAPTALIIVDDAARDGEKRMLACWAEEYPAFKQIGAYCEKGCVLAERKSGHN